MSLQVQALINVTNAAWVAITCKAWARRVEIAEDGSGSGQGLLVQWPNGNQVNYTPAQQPIVLSSPGGGSGIPLGQPADSARGALATQYCQVKSMGAATVVRVSETN